MQNRTVALKTNKNDKVSHSKKIGVGVNKLPGNQTLK
jgi:hypothetical protein